MPPTPSRQNAVLTKDLDSKGPERWPERTSRAPKFKAPQRPSLLHVAERRTPQCRYSTWGSFERRKCVVTLGSEDLRVYVADHKPPMVFDLERLKVGNWKENRK